MTYKLPCFLKHTYSECSQVWQDDLNKKKVLHYNTTDFFKSDIQSNKGLITVFIIKINNQVACILSFLGSLFMLGLFFCFFWGVVVLIFVFFCEGSVKYNQT